MTSETEAWFWVNHQTSQPLPQERVCEREAVDGRSLFHMDLVTMPLQSEDFVIQANDSEQLTGEALVEWQTLLYQTVLGIEQ